MDDRYRDIWNISRLRFLFLIVLLLLSMLFVLDRSLPGELFDDFMEDLEERIARDEKKVKDLLKVYLLISTHSIGY